MKHIFVVDDEQNIRQLIEKYLAREGYQVTTFSDGTNVVKEVSRLSPDLIVLDIMMPTISGIDVLRELRKISDIPVVVVSARSEEYDRIIGIELGADDYMTKPFSPRELTVRINGIFRRLKRTDPQKDVLSYKDVTIDHRKRTAFAMTMELALTVKEFDFLALLIANPEMSFTRQQIIDHVWGVDFYGEERLVDDLVKRIRKKLTKAESEVKVTTVWGYGYKSE